MSHLALNKQISPHFELNRLRNLSQIDKALTNLKYTKPYNYTARTVGDVKPFQQTINMFKKMVGQNKSGNTMLRDTITRNTRPINIKSGLPRQFNVTGRGIRKVKNRVKSGKKISTKKKVKRTTKRQQKKKKNRYR